jgi:predicted DNA-binding transcriptional regulator AlpA
MKSSVPRGKWLSVPQMSQMSGIGTSKLYDMIRRRDKTLWRVYMPIDGMYKSDSADIQDWLESRRVI